MANNESAAATPKGKRDRSRNHPTVSLPRCTEFMQDIKRKMAYRPFTRQALAAAFGIQAGSGAFSTKVAACGQFGLLEDVNGTIHISALGKRVLDPVSEADKTAAIVEAFTRPALYQELLRDMSSNQLPEELGNILLHQYRISDSAKENAAKCFEESARYAGLLDTNGILRSPDDSNVQTAIELGFEAPIESDATQSQKAIATGKPGSGSRGAPSDQQTIILTLADGKIAHLILPAVITNDDMELLDAQLAVFRLQAKRTAREQSTNSIEQDTSLKS